ncbi:MAG: hypothetical protein ACC707_05205 [Thiohalomonadales bacterium]
MNTVDLQQLEEKFGQLSNQALTQFAKPYICQIVYTENADVKEEASGVLDMIYTECVGRGIEKLYDLTYEAVSKNPELCNVA